MSTHTYIAGDWGSSNLRLYLCQLTDAQPVRLLDTRHGAGVLAVDGDFAGHLRPLIQPWLDTHGSLPVILAGMVGSNIGWQEAPYLRCPVDGNRIAGGRISFELDGLKISILAGLRTRNPLGMVDVMRGEELQLLGWLHGYATAEQSSRLFALPGTHNKWALLQGDEIQTFTTAFTGEMFALFRQHSVLISNPDAIEIDQGAFVEGVEIAKTLESGQLVHALFSVRSRQVLGELHDRQALSYLSGLLIGADIAGALAMYKHSADRPSALGVIGEPVLTGQYLLALEVFEITAQDYDAADIALHGFAAIFRNIYLS